MPLTGHSMKAPPLAQTSPLQRKKNKQNCELRQAARAQGSSVEGDFWCEQPPFSGSSLGSSLLVHWRSGLGDC